MTIVIDIGPQLMRVLEAVGGLVIMYIVTVAMFGGRR